MNSADSLTIPVNTETHKIHDKIQQVSLTDLLEDTQLGEGSGDVQLDQLQT